jgi:hypothetical protein
MIAAELYDAAVPALLMAAASAAEPIYGGICSVMKSNLGR